MILIYSYLFCSLLCLMDVLSRSQPLILPYLLQIHWSSLLSTRLVFTILVLVLFMLMNVHLLFTQCTFNYAVWLNRNGLIQVYSLIVDPVSGSVYSIKLFASVSTPFAVSYHSIKVDSDLDCILLYNPKDSSSSSLLLYTSQLELRGYIEVSQIDDVFITNYGIIAISGSYVSRYSFCGDLDGCIDLSHIM